MIRCLPLILSLIFLGCSCGESEPTPESKPSPRMLLTAGADAPDIDTRTDEDRREEAALLAEQEEIKAKLEAGEAITEEEEVSDLSEFQRWMDEKGSLPTEFDPTVPAWLRFARWAMSEGPQDREALLQMAGNIRHRGEDLSKTIARRAPHVSRLKKPKAGRQLVSGSYSAEGKEPPPYWFECREIKKVTLKSGKQKWKKLPEGCHGFWKKTGPQWFEMREWAKRNIHRRPRVIKGVPIDQGGIMDVWRVLQMPEYAHLCFCGQPNPPKGNLFYCLKKDPRNTCLPVPDQIVNSSKTISAALFKKRTVFQKARRKARAKK